MEHELTKIRAEASFSLKTVVRSQLAAARANVMADEETKRANALQAQLAALAGRAKPSQHPTQNTAKSGSRLDMTSFKQLDAAQYKPARRRFQEQATFWCSDKLHDRIEAALQWTVPELRADGVAVSAAKLVRTLAATDEKEGVVIIIGGVVRDAIEDKPINDVDMMYAIEGAEKTAQRVADENGWKVYISPTRKCVGSS